MIPLLLGIVYAPLFYGTTTTAAVWGLDALVLSCVVLWLYQKYETSEEFAVTRFPLIVVGILGLIAVAQVLNPHAVFDSRTWDLRDLDGGLPLLPRTMDQTTSLALLPHSLIFGAGLVAVMDLCRWRENRWRIIRVIAATGTAVALIGMLQKAAGGDRILWGHLHPNENTFFAAFRYHGHAASFLNLAWPAAAALFLRSIYREKDISRNLWGLAWLLIFAGLFVNTSKFGQVAAVPLLMFAGIVFIRHFPRDWMKPNWRSGLIGLVVVGAIAGLAIPSLTSTVSNWERHLDEGITLQLRLAAYEVCLSMIREVPLFGFGTGSFRILFPYYATDLEGSMQGIWSHAHQDYLETVIEWGWIGAGLWAVLFFPPMARQLKRSLGRHADLTGAVALIGLAAVTLHGMVDFPFQIASIQFYCLLYLAVLWRPHRK